MSDKRKRDTDSVETEDIIQAALREEQEAKKAKKQVGPDSKDAADKGKTLGDIEEEEGGTIKESQVAMAQAKRTQKRKARKEDREGTSSGSSRLIPTTDSLQTLGTVPRSRADQGIGSQQYVLHIRHNNVSTGSAFSCT